MGQQIDADWQWLHTQCERSVVIVCDLGYGAL
jgi:hypothetical protein